MAKIILDSMVRVPVGALSIRQRAKIRKGLRIVHTVNRAKRSVLAYYEKNGHICLPRQWEGSRTILERNRFVDRRSNGSPIGVRFHSDEGWRRGQEAFKNDLVRGLRADGLGGIGWAECGFGKTAMALAVAAELDLTTLILVHTEPIQREWIESARKFWGEEPGIVQSDKCEFRDRKVVVAMVHSIARRKSYPEELYRWPGLVIFDECLAGDTLVLTERGQVPIVEIPCSGAKYVLTFNESLQIWEHKPIVRLIRQGMREIVRVRTERGEISCTTDHRFLTERGWVEARHLIRADRILSPVPADAGQRSQDFGQTANRDASSSDIRFNDASTAPHDEFCSKQMPRCAAAAAARKFACQSLLKPLAEPGRSGPSSYQGIIDHELIEDHLNEMSSVLFMGHCLEMDRSPDLIAGPIPVFAGTTDRYRSPGLTTKRNGSLVLASAIRPYRTVDTVRPASMGLVCATLVSFRFLKSLVSRKDPRLSGYRISPKKDGPGGTWMMAPSGADSFGFIPRASTTSESVSSLRHCANLDSIPSWIELVGATGFLDSESEMPYDGLNGSDPTLLQAWTTSSIEVLSVEQIGTMEPVFDLEIEDNHNFVANGLLVHNCHHTPARTFLKAITSFPARYYLGLSATPRRSDGLEDIFFWTIGDILCKGEGDKLACRIWQVIYRPDISWEDIEIREQPNFTKLVTLLTEDPHRTALMCRIIARAVRKGRRVLVLTSRLDHIAEIKAQLEDMFRRESYTVGHYRAGKTKKAMADKNYAREANVCIGTDRIVKEGFNVPALDTLVLASPMKDAQQVVGRIRRLLKSKKEPAIVDIQDDHPFLYRSSNARLKYYRREKWPIRTVQ